MERSDNGSVREEVQAMTEAIEAIARGVPPASAVLGYLCKSFLGTVKRSPVGRDPDVHLHLGVLFVARTLELGHPAGGIDEVFTLLRQQTERALERVAQERART